MKNKTIFILALITICLNAKLDASNAGAAVFVDKNQESLFESGKRWNIGRNSFSEEPIDPYNRWMTNYLTFDGDTTINGNEYKILYQSRDSLFNSKSIAHFMRKDSTGRIFSSKTGSIDVVTFDFSLDKGDTIILSTDFVSQLGTVCVRVDSVGFVKLNNNILYKAQFISVFPYYNNEMKEDMSIPDVWIYGIGSLKFGLITSYVFSTGWNTSSVLLCHSSNNELIYMNPEYNTCEISTAIERHGVNDKLIDLVPKGSGVFQLNLRDGTAGNLSVFDITGKQVVREKRIYSSTQVIIPIAGLHLYRFINNNNQVQTGKVLVR